SCPLCAILFLSHGEPPGLLVGGTSILPQVRCGSFSFFHCPISFYNQPSFCKMSFPANFMFDALTLCEKSCTIENDRTRRKAAVAWICLT
ncbi:MAG: hypothetical protein PUC00_01990, partial [Clostridiales bacterium]|nr:hypothetical protein [Clostridiales bacterium]